MNPVELALLGPAAVAVVLGSVIGFDRLREPHRDLRRPCAVVDKRTFRDARRRVEKLAASGDFGRAWAGCVAICTWLKAERLYGGPRRRAWFARELEVWTARRSEFNPQATAPDQAR